MDSEGRQGIIDLVVPYPAVFGAHHILSSFYGYSNHDASRVLQNFQSIGRIHWFGAIDRQLSTAGLSVAGSANIEGWDGLYAATALQEGVSTVLTLGDDFDRVDGVESKVILSQDEFRQLDDYLNAL